MPASDPNPENKPNDAPNNSDSDSESDIPLVPYPRCAKIESGPFTYAGNGWAKGLTVNRVKRCESDELMKLLTYVEPAPLLTKKGKPRVHQPPPHKDKDEEFYMAQVVHYGLKKEDCEGKEGAKSALLEFARTNKGKGKKDREGKFVVPGEIVEMEKRLHEEWEAADAKWKAELEVYRAQSDKRDAKREKKRKREEDRILDGFFGEEFSEEGRKKRAKVEEAPTPINLDNLSGDYEIVAPGLEDGWEECRDLTFNLSVSSTGSNVWGSFHFGVVEGELRALRFSRASFKDTIRFHWQGCETGEGEITCEPENIAELTFLADGKFRGEMYWEAYGDFNIAGKKKEEEKPPVKAASAKKIRKLKAKYRENNNAKWSAQNDRFNDYAGDPRPNIPEDSDTTDADEDEPGNEFMVFKKPKKPRRQWVTVRDGEDPNDFI